MKVKVGDTVNQGSVILTPRRGAQRQRRRRAAPPAARRRAARGGRAAAPRGGLRRCAAPAIAARSAAAAAAGSLPVGGDIDLRPARARRRPRRLLGRVPRRRPRPQDGARRALQDARRRLPQRRLHSVEGDAARRRGDRRGRRISARIGIDVRRADGRSRQAASRTRTRSSASSPAASRRWRRCARSTVVTGSGRFIDSESRRRRARGRRHDDDRLRARRSSRPAPKR